MKSSGVAMNTRLERVAPPSQRYQSSDSAVGRVDLAGVRGTVAELAAICQAWGAALAELHTESTHRSAAPLASRPLILNSQKLMRSIGRAAKGSGYAAVLEAYYSPDLRAAVREVDERWTEQHWIHGDLIATNVLVEQTPALRVNFAHLENIGLGDPAWDLASAVDTILWLSPRWHVLSKPLVDYLLLGYWRAGGHARLYPAMQAVRALATGLQVAGPEDESTGPECPRADLAIWLDRARAYAERVGCLRAVA
jgi:aminoglycoside phosphotransferase (APT) family kinase protein